MRDMVAERDGRTFDMDHRYCIDNGAMIAVAGLMEFRAGGVTLLEDSWCTQRYRTDVIECVWRNSEVN